MVAAGWRAALPIPTASRALPSAKLMTARSWSTVMPAVIKSTSSPLCAPALCGQRNAPERPGPGFTPFRGNQPDHDDAKRTEAAVAIWHTAKPANGTPVETYLARRGLQLPMPQTLRFQAGLKHRSGGVWPAMVALVTQGVEDVPVGVHRTFLARDGSSKAPVDPQKMMLGPCKGGAVRLAPAGDVLMVGEGIETCLAGVQATGYPAWAALSTSGLLALDLPPDVRDVMVLLADGDEAGKAAARGAALRWKREGRGVRIAQAPEGMDFNDMLLGRVPANGGDM